MLPRLTTKPATSYDEGFYQPKPLSPDQRRRIARMQRELVRLRKELAKALGVNS